MVCIVLEWDPLEISHSETIQRSTTTTIPPPAQKFCPVCPNLVNLEKERMSVPMALNLPRPCLSCGAPTAPGAQRCAPCGSSWARHERMREREKRARREAAAKEGGAARRMRAEIRHNLGTHCRACLRWAPARLIEVDHILPLVDGGQDTPENVQPLCVPCHRSKTREERDARGGLH